MATSDKLTFKSNIVISAIMGAITGTSVFFGVKSEISQVNAKLDIYIASNVADKTIMNYRVDVIEKKMAQIDINPSAKKTIADFIEPKRIEISKQR